MATTGWGLIYFNLLNIFNLYNLHTSLPLSSRSAWHPHSSRPFVICCTAQSTFLPISRFPALSPLKLGRGALFATGKIICVNLGLTKAKKTICVNFPGAGRKKKRPFERHEFPSFPPRDFHAQDDKIGIFEHFSNCTRWNCHRNLNTYWTANDKEFHSVVHFFSFPSLNQRKAAP